MLESPVLDLQEQAGASVGEAHGWRLPRTYTSVADEYEALTEGVGLIDRSYVGRLRFSGVDALDLLDRLSTNQLDDLTVGRGIHTVLTSNKGRILDLLLVQRLEDHLLVLTAPENRQMVADHIDFFTFTEDVTVEDVTNDSAMLSLVGPKAAAVLADVMGEQIPDLAEYDSASAIIEEAQVLVMRTDFAGPPSYELIVPAARGQVLWARLLDNVDRSGIRPVGTEAMEIVRVEHGIPLFGVDMSESNNPLEADLLRFISFTKGCYVGQEVVTRLNTYQKVQKHLVGLAWDVAVEPESGSPLFGDDGKEVGAISSAVTPPRLGRGIGLGYVKKGFEEPGVRLAIGSSDGPRTAEVVSLPLKP